MWKAIHRLHPYSPPFLTLFVTSRCNLSCDHCFFWQSLNQRDDLTLDEIKKLSDEIGTLENLNLTGGEPFLRKDLDEICRLFVSKNKVRQIYITTNAFFTENMLHQIQAILGLVGLGLLVVEISLDGMQDYHNRLRGNSQSFQKALESYQALAEIHKKDGRLRIHVDSAVSSENMEEVRTLSRFLHAHFPCVDHHGLGIIRGDWKGKRLKKPPIQGYLELYRDIESVWSKGERERFGSIVEPMIQWAKCETVNNNRQVVSCLAGTLHAVVFPDGGLGLCELQPSVGNLREKKFFELWHSPEAERLRLKVKAKECYCTHEIPLWSSIVFQPFELFRAMTGSRVWKRVL